MKIVIDTSSLLSLVRYYLPFDIKNKLFDIIKNKIANAEILVIDKIIEECEYISKGTILQTFEFLKDKDFNRTHKLPLNTDFLLPPAPARFYRMVDNNFVVTVQRARLNETQYISLKNDFMNSADMKMILTCLNLIKENPTLDIILVTEETEISNDNKVFKKIPAICSQLGIKTMNIQQLVAKFEDLTFEIK